jgi:hypothetical protein
MGREDSQALEGRSNDRLEFLQEVTLREVILRDRQLIDRQAWEERSHHGLESIPSIDSWLFANHPLIKTRVPRENAPAQMRAMVAYSANDHGGMDQGDDDDCGSEDDVGMPLDWF